jgi:hypothetical protein
MYRDKKSPGIHAEAEVVQFEEVGRDEPAGSQSVREEGVVGAWRLRPRFDPKSIRPRGRN